MSSANIEERFNAAVNVIRNLPKNGSFQPSNAMMLTFYAYFKQATEGPCNQKKPNFWDVVRKAKWDSWNALGNMSRERAMELYVDELKKIIETMSYTENVANFMGSISELDNINLDDLDLIAPDAMERARSHPNSPIASRGSSPKHTSPLQNGFPIGNLQALSNDASNYLHQNGYTVDQSDDEYIDTVEDDHETQSLKRQRIMQNQNASSRSDIGFEISRENVSPILQQILGTVQRMNADINNVNQNIKNLEKYFLELKNEQNKLKLSLRKYPSWWPFIDISPIWFAFLILWPFLAQRLGRVLQQRKK